MDKFIVEGGRELSGTVQVSGAKNAALPLMAATLLWPGNYTLHRVPLLKDTDTFVKVLQTTGAVATLETDSLSIDTRNCDSAGAPYELVKQMRASFYVLGPLLARFGTCKVSMPGGCNWGPRPVDLHLRVLEALGAKIQLESGYIIASGNLKGANYTFPISSVGATGNGLMASVLAEGVTVLRNVAVEPEIVELGNFLNTLGAQIEGLGTRTLTISGVDELQAADATVIPDRIEAGTFLIAAAMTGKGVTVEGADPSHLGSIIDLLKEAGASVQVDGAAITVSRPDTIAPVDITTAPYPGYPTDLQAQWMALMTQASGDSTIIEDVYHDRFSHLPELTRLGASISLKGNVAQISAPTPLLGAPVMSTDIRASAAIVLAALVANGTTEISRVYHIDRGYEAIEKKLAQLGANITRAKDET